MLPGDEQSSTKPLLQGHSRGDQHPTTLTSCVFACRVLNHCLAPCRQGLTLSHISCRILTYRTCVQVTLVINYDVPTEKDFVTPAFETYLHRIGRSGRFGRKGAAFNFVSGQQACPTICYALPMHAHLHAGDAATSGPFVL